MADPYQRPNGGIAEPEKCDSLSTKPGSRRRQSSSDQHHRQRTVIEEVQKPVGGVSPCAPTDDTQSRPHNTHALLPTTAVANPPYEQSSSHSSSLYASGQSPMHTLHTDMDRDCESSQFAEHEAYHTCPLQCPVNKESMAELELSRIIINVKLRNDVNYDRELHFRPNFDGRYGKQKMLDTKKYWLAVGYELQLVEDIVRQRINASSSAKHSQQLQQRLKSCKKRLPHVFSAIKDILISLVPEVDQQRIKERLDVELIMQQIDNGVCDLKDLATWLAKIITTHCAPMRDGQVEKMVRTVVEATSTQQTAKLTTGLRQLVDIMEAMKLDIANHQIRHVRAHLIAGTVPFQKRYNEHRVTQGKIDIRKSRVWLQREYDRSQGTVWPVTKLEAFCSALLDDMMSVEPEFTPTLYLDRDRLRGLSMEVHSYLCREICHSIMTALLPDSFDIVLSAWSMLQSFLMTINGLPDHFVRNIDNITAQMCSIIAMYACQTDLPDTSIAVEASKRLRKDLMQDSPAYQKQQTILINRLTPKLYDSVHNHINLTPLELQDTLIPTQSTISRRVSGFGAILEPARTSTPVDPDHVLIRKLTHIIVIHWQVWSDLYESAPLDELGYDLCSHNGIFHVTAPNGPRSVEDTVASES